MKKIRIAPEKEEKQEKLKIQDIKKNSSSDVLHTIKKIQMNERRMVMVLSCIFVIVFLVLGYFIFSDIQDSKVPMLKVGPLEVDFGNDSNGMNDIINFYGDSMADGEVADATSHTFNIKNTSKEKRSYKVYLEDYEDMIMYDGCREKLFDQNNILFTIDKKNTKSLASVYEDGRYLLIQDEISGNKEVKHNVVVWYTINSDSHFHGKIVVEYVG